MGRVHSVNCVRAREGARRIRPHHTAFWSCRYKRVCCDQYFRHLNRLEHNGNYMYHTFRT